MELIDEEMNLQLLNAELSTKRMTMQRKRAAVHIPNNHPAIDSQAHDHRARSSEHVYTRQVFIYEEEVDVENL